jgi:5-carboxymethyl-2-hydroxymuconate isomerase
MPHCIIEYSRELQGFIQPEFLINSVHLGAVKSELFETLDIKTRILPFEYSSSGGVKQDFIHVTIKILSGRSMEQRKSLSNCVLIELDKLPITSVSLTVEVVDIEKESYGKLVK